MQTPTPKIRRFGQVIRVKPERLEEYRTLHDNIWLEVQTALKAANIQNYSIFWHDNTLFGYLEYTGSDWQADQRLIGSFPRLDEWSVLTAAMQEPLESRATGEWWANMTEVFHLD
jgi:L-rhamnose mutarotase